MASEIRINGSASSSVKEGQRGVPMKGLFRDHRILCARILIGFFTVVGLLSGSKTWGVDSPGLELSLYTQHQQYALGDPISLVMVLKNVAGQSIVTTQDFSKVELHRCLRITDPAGTQHTFSIDPEVHEMPAPFFWQDKAWSRTETLLPDFVLSETVEDLRVLLPMMGGTTGWYTVGARVSFVRYENGETKVHSRLGTLGQVDSPNNWEGTIDSNKVQIFISPSQGAQFQVQVFSQSTIPLPQVPVKVFKASDIPSGLALEQVWSDVEPVLSGTTGFGDGLVKTWEGSPCQPQGNYTVIALYQGEYKQADLEAEDTGWAQECSGIVVKEIVFGEAKWPVSHFSIVASNSVYLKANARVNSGNVGVLIASPGPWLNSGVEVSLAANVRAQEGVQIYGDSVKIASNASVDDVFYNNLIKQGVIRGEGKQGLSLPLPIDLPVFPDFAQGTADKTVSANKTMTLDPGSYRNVVVKPKGTLKLSGGVYNFEGLTLQSNAILQFLGRTEVRIKQRLSTAPNVQMIPSGGTLGAKDLIVYVQGINGSDGDLGSTPEAAALGENNTVKANFLVPNGTLSIGANAKVTGSLVAKDVSVGSNGSVSLESGF
jgi:hypothetical protein